MAHTTDARTLHIHQAMTYRATFEWLTNGATPVPISLAGYTVVFEIVSRAGKLPPIVMVDSNNFDVDNGGVEVEPYGEVGVVRVTLTAAQTGSLKRDAAYALYASPSSASEPVEYIASGPASLIKVGA